MGKEWAYSSEGENFLIHLNSYWKLNNETNDILRVYSIVKNTDPEKSFSYTTENKESLTRIFAMNDGKLNIK